MADFGMIDERLREIQSMLTGPASGDAPADPAGRVAVAPPSHAYELPPAQPPPPPLSRFAAPIPPSAPAPPPIAFTEPAPARRAGFPLEHPNTPSPVDLAERAVIEPAEARARALIATAELEAARIVADARAEVQDLARQIDELVILRDRLAQSVTEYQHALAAQGSLPAPTAPEAPAAPIGPADLPGGPDRLPPAAAYAEPSAAEPAERYLPPEPVAPVTHAHPPGSWESSTPSAPYAPAAVSHYAGAPAAPEPVYAPAPVPAAIVPGTFGSFGGVATLIVGHFEDVGSIERFEQQLMSLTSLGDVYLRAYDSGRAIFELTLPAPAPLVSELQAVAAIAVVNETPAALVASLGAGRSAAMKAIVMVLTSFAICVGFVVFFAAFTQVPLLMLGLFLVIAINRTRRRKPARTAVIDTADFEVDP